MLSRSYDDDDDDMKQASVCQLYFSVTFRNN